MKRGAGRLLDDLYLDLHAIDANSVILVTSRLPNEQLYLDLSEQPAMLESAGIKSVIAIGDCLCPSTIASAVYDGEIVDIDFV